MSAQKDGETEVLLPWEAEIYWLNPESSEGLPPERKIFFLEEMTVRFCFDGPPDREEAKKMAAEIIRKRMNWRADDFEVRAVRLVAPRVPIPDMRWTKTIADDEGLARRAVAQHKARAQMEIG